MGRTRSAFSTAVCLTALLAATGCVSTGDGTDRSRRQHLVWVPPGAPTVEALRWSDIREFVPLNERMIVVRTRERPHLLLLARPCRGLQRHSTIVYERRRPTFSPREDGIGALIRGPLGVIVPCAPEALYAIRPDDVHRLEAALGR
jgi:hypothetical protein